MSLLTLKTPAARCSVAGILAPTAGLLFCTLGAGIEVAAAADHQSVFRLDGSICAEQRPDDLLPPALAGQTGTQRLGIHNLGSFNIAAPNIDRFSNWGEIDDDSVGYLNCPLGVPSGSGLPSSYSAIQLEFTRLQLGSTGLAKKASNDADCVLVSTGADIEHVATSMRGGMVPMVETIGAARTVDGLELAWGGSTLADDDLTVICRIKAGVMLTDVQIGIETNLEVAAE